MVRLVAYNAMYLKPESKPVGLFWAHSLGRIFLALYVPSPPSPSFKVCFPVRLYKPNHFRLDD